MRVKKPEARWILPVDTKYPENNVWVMLSKGVGEDNADVQSIRVFTDRPHDSTIDYEFQQFSASHHDVEVRLFEVALDFFDPGDEGFHPC